MKIVTPTDTNLAHLVQLLKELHGAGTFGITGPDFDWNYTMQSMRDCIRNDNFYIRMAYDDDDAPCGCVGGQVFPHYFSPRLMGCEEGWFVREGTPYRAKIGMMLMRGFMDWAFDIKNVTHIQSGDIAAIDTVAVWTLYRHMGFTRFGSIYKYTRGHG